MRANAEKKGRIVGYRELRRLARDRRGVRMHVKIGIDRIDERRCDRRQRVGRAGGIGDPHVLNANGIRRARR